MRFTGIDLLRGIAAFGIVGCHLCLSPRTDGGNLVTALCDFNVGVFAAVAGFLMCRRDKADQIGFGAYLEKRAKRLLPTYFFWSFVFVFATVSFDFLLDGGRLNPKYGTVPFWVRVVFGGDASTHLWFLVCLFYAQVVLWRCFRGCYGKWSGVMWIALGGAAIVGSVIMDNWFGRYPLRLVAFLMTGYGLACCLCGDALKFFKRHRILIWCLAGGVLAAHVMARAATPGFIRDWIAVMPVLVAFVLLDFRGEGFVKIAGFLGATSMGIYLIHPLVTRGLSVAITRIAQSPYSAQIVLLEWIVAWSLSLAAAYLLGRLPVVKRFV